MASPKARRSSGNFRFDFPEVTESIPIFICRDATQTSIELSAGRSYARSRQSVGLTNEAKNESRAMPETEPLSPRKTALVLLVVGGCFAVLWPKLLQPVLLGRSSHDPLAPNRADRAQGCCDVIFETDVNAIKIMIELCGNILERKRGPLDPRTASAFASGKLPPDIIATCRLEVNATCGVDISTFLQQNVKLGKSYKQILEDVRSYNSSACLKMHFGVPISALGTGHAIGKTGSVQELDNIKQERNPHLRAGYPHPAMLERGRAIPSSDAPLPPGGPPSDTVQRVAGRVRSPLSVYYEDEPPPVPGVRPPMGGAGGQIPAPKGSVGFVMPVYTICILVFFVYTLCKILFKRTDTTAGGNYDSVTPDPMFRSRVFEDHYTSSVEPDDKFVVSAISGLVAEVQQQMESSYAQSHRANGAQVPPGHTDVPYTNGTLRSARDTSPIHIVAKEYKEVSHESVQKIRETARELTPEPKEHITKELTPESKELTPESCEPISAPKELTPEPKEPTPEPKELIPESRELTPKAWKPTSAPKDLTAEPRELTPESKELTPESWEPSPESKELTPESKELTSELKVLTPESWEPTPSPKEPTPEQKELISESKEMNPESWKSNLTFKELTTEPEKRTPELPETKHMSPEPVTDEIVAGKQSTPELLADAIKEESPREENVFLANGGFGHKDERDDEIDEALSEEEIEYEIEEDEDESPLVRQLRASVEKDKATVKVLGMEMTAHCEGGAEWGDRPLSPPACPRHPPPAPVRPHEAAEVSSIYLAGDIPQQSRLLVADCDTDRASDGKDSPVVLSGKMTLSLINDEAEQTPDRELESTATLDDDYTTASAYTQPKNNQQEEELSEEEIEEEVEEVEEIEEVEEEEEEEHAAPSVEQ